MKIRTDFVTNSSSSSFILARKPHLNEKQKAAIIRYIEENMLGKLLLSPGSTEEEIQKAFEDSYEFEDEDRQEQVREALQAGKSIYCDWVCFEESDYQVTKVYQDIWELMEENSDGDFEAIDDDLMY